jgi:hypothetical protein
MRYQRSLLFIPLLLGLNACLVPPPPPCANGVRDFNESDVDCGGGCAACPAGFFCRTGTDCQSGVCGPNGRCAATVNPCTNGVRDGFESDIDCGGGQCPVCPNGLLCRTGADCQSGSCGSNGRCAATVNPCTNGVRDGFESDIDCGGGQCPVCPNGRRCYASTDCQSGLCAAGQCSTAPYQGGAVPPQTTVVYAIQPGASTVVQPGVQAGYGITANIGGSYRLVWTGDISTSGTYREFWGSVWTRGSFSALVRGCNGSVCPLEQGDLVSNPVTIAGGQRIDFDSFATDNLDGFDFVVTAEPVYFDLYIDGVRYPNLVFFPATANGGQISNVATIPFGLTTQ